MESPTATLVTQMLLCVAIAVAVAVASVLRPLVQNTELRVRTSSWNGDTGANGRLFTGFPYPFCRNDVKTKGLERLSVDET